MGSQSKMYQLVSSTKDLESKELKEHNVCRVESACKDNHSCSKKHQRRAVSGVPQHVNEKGEKGETVIDDEEFDLMKLKELKAYCSNYDELQNTKAEDQYCQCLVEQCRSRLLTGIIIMIITKHPCERSFHEFVNPLPHLVIVICHKAFWLSTLYFQCY
ncbi:UNVERIFIED_CONTAM: hypothetical protein FKN15_069718 [Acipenser sinensis]